MIFGNWFVLADAAASGPAQGGGSGAFIQMIVPFLILGAIFYFMVIRPQQNQKKAHQDLITKLKAGDKVVTAGGIHGVVQTVRKDTVLIKVDEKARLEMSLGSIVTVIADATSAGAADERAAAKDDDKAKNDDKSKK